MSKSAAKSRTAHVCNECGAEYAKWQGQCDACGAWNALSEIVLESAAAAKSPSIVSWRSPRALKGSNMM